MIGEDCPITGRCPAGNQCHAGPKTYARSPYDACYSDRCVKDYLADEDRCWGIAHTTDYHRSTYDLGITNDQETVMDSVIILMLNQSTSRQIFSTLSCMLEYI